MIVSQKPHMMILVLFLYFNLVSHIEFNEDEFNNIDPMLSWCNTNNQNEIQVCSDEGLFETPTNHRMSDSNSDMSIANSYDPYLATVPQFHPYYNESLFDDSSLSESTIKDVSQIISFPFLIIFKTQIFYYSAIQ